MTYGKDRPKCLSDVFNAVSAEAAFFVFGKGVMGKSERWLLRRRRLPRYCTVSFFIDKLVDLGCRH